MRRYVLLFLAVCCMEIHRGELTFLTFENDLVTFLTGIDLVLFHQFLPVFFAMFRQDAGAFTKWAKVVEGGKDCRADELGTVLHSCHQLFQRLVHLKGDHFKIFGWLWHGLGLLHLYLIYGFRARVDSHSPSLSITYFE